MSKASEWAERVGNTNRPENSRMGLFSFEATPEGILRVACDALPGCRISATTTGSEAVKLARWILDTFGEAP